MTIEIHGRNLTPIKCRSLECACNRIAEMRRRSKGCSYCRPVLWLVDTEATTSYEIKRPGKRLCGKVFVRGCGGKAQYYVNGAVVDGTPTPLSTWGGYARTAVWLGAAQSAPTHQH